MYKAAKRILDDSKRYRFQDAPDDDEVDERTIENNAELHVMYILSNHSKFKKIDDTLVSKYESILTHGNRPSRVTQWESFVAICGSMYKLEAAKDTKACIPSPSNPYKLLCKCYGGRSLKSGKSCGYRQRSTVIHGDTQ